MAIAGPAGPCAMPLQLHVKPGSQYDAGAASVVNIMEKVFFHQSNCIPDVKFFDNGRWLTFATLCWNRNRVYSSVTPTLATLRWRERRIVNQA